MQPQDIEKHQELKQTVFKVLEHVSNTSESTYLSISTGVIAISIIFADSEVAYVFPEILGISWLLLAASATLSHMLNNARHKWATRVLEQVNNAESESRNVKESDVEPAQSEFTRKKLFLTKYRNRSFYVGIIAFILFVLTNLIAHQEFTTLRFINDATDQKIETAPEYRVP